MGPPRLLARDKDRPTHPFRSSSAKKFARQWASSSISAKNFAQHAIKRPFWAILSTQGELFRAHAHHQAAQGELFRAQGAALGNCETAITTARP